jgi:hypothetical protein
LEDSFSANCKSLGAGNLRGSLEMKASGGRKGKDKKKEKKEVRKDKRKQGGALHKKQERPDHHASKARGGGATGASSGGKGKGGKGGKGKGSGASGGKGKGGGGSRSFAPGQSVPSNLTFEACERLGRQRPRGHPIDKGTTEGMHRFRCILPDLKSTFGNRSDKDLIFCTRDSYSTEQEAKEQSSLLALFHLQPTMPLHSRLTEPYKSLWLAMVSAGSGARAAASTGGSAKVDTKKAEKMMGTFFADSKHATDASVAKRLIKHSLGEDKASYRVSAKPIAKQKEAQKEAKTGVNSFGAGLWGSSPPTAALPRASATSASSMLAAEDAAGALKVPTMDSKHTSRAAGNRARAEKEQTRKTKTHKRENIERNNEDTQVGYNSGIGCGWNRVGKSWHSGGPLHILCS